MADKSYKKYKGKYQWGAISDKIYDFNYTPKKLSKIQVAKEYADLKTRKYTYEEFSKYYKGEPDKLNENWKKQQYKQKMIEEGAYSQYKDWIYHESYVGTLVDIFNDTADYQYAKVLQSLSKSQWHKLWNYKVPQKSASEKYEKGYILPSLASLGPYKIEGMYDGDKEALQVFKEDLRNALIQVLGIDPELRSDINVRNNASLFTNSKFYSIIKFSRKGYTIDTRKFEEDGYIDDNKMAELIAYNILKDREDRGKLYTISKYGKKYIRGVSKLVQSKYETWKLKNEGKQ